MYTPWQPEWLGLVDYDLDGNPKPAYILWDLHRLSLLWLDHVIESKVRSAKAAIAYSAESHKVALGYTARRVGMRTALDVALAEMPDAHTTPAWEPNRYRHEDGYKRPTLWGRVRYSKYTPRRIGRRVTGKLSQGLRAAARWLDDHTYGW